MADVHVDDADAAMPNAPEQTTEAATAPAAPESGNEAPLSAAAQPAGAEATDATVSADPANPLEAKYDEYWAAVTANPSSFQTWTQLISAADKLGDLAKSRAVYDAFLSEYPLCYGYWKKYADLELRHANQEAAMEVFERGVAAIPYSVDLWVHYCGAVQLRPDATPEMIRGHYARALTYVASDWRSHSLWDKYLTYEASTGDVTKLTAVYVQILQHPIRELDRYYHGLREFSVTKTASELLMEGQFNDIMSELYRKKTAPAEVASLSGEAPAAGAGAGASATQQGAAAPGGAAAEAAAAAGATQNDAAPAAALSVPGVPGPATSDAPQPETAPGDAPPGTQAAEEAMDCDEPAPPGDSGPPAGAAAGNAPAGAAAGAAVEISDEEIKAAWLAACDLKYEAAKQEALKRKEFEDLIKRPYFHVKPLDAVQLAAWSGYLQYACDSCSPADCVALHERALIACANYPEFWRRYVFYLLSTADAERARSALDRGTRVYCKQQPSMHLFAARFLEQQGQLQPARDCYSHVLDTLAPGLLQGVVERANFERRHAGLEAACEVYEEAIKRSQGQAAQPVDAPADAALAQPTPTPAAAGQGLDRPSEGPSDGEAALAPAPPEQPAAVTESGEEQGAAGGSGDGGEADAERESALQAAAFLSVKFADFLLRVASDPERARTVLTEALKVQPQCRALWEAATAFEEEVGGSARVSRVMALFDRCLATQPEAAPSRQLSEADREALSQRAVAFADAYGDAQLLQQVSRQHAELFLLPSVVVETARKRTAAQALVAESRAGGNSGGGSTGDTKHVRHSEDASQAAAGNGPLVAAGSTAAAATQPAAAAAMPHAATSGHHGYFQQPAGYNGYASYYSGYPASATAYGQYPGYGY